ncbi:hypothetical protein EIP86_002822 [Pleurotus ostreatoroseus]|nr:hypothetical protein EIP86_002822 [Pleurotus ostreatoroseus]
MSSIKLRYIHAGNSKWETFGRGSSIPNEGDIVQDVKDTSSLSRSALHGTPSRETELSEIGFELRRVVHTSYDSYDSDVNVYEISLSLTESSSSEIATYMLPSLVAKISRTGNGYEHLRRETWYYEALADLQGSVIPRCFGLFEADFHGNYALDVAEPPASTADIKISGRVSVLLMERLGARLSALRGMDTEKTRIEALTIDLYGLGNKASVMTRATFERGIAAPNDEMIIEEEPGEMVARRPSALPEPGTMKAHITLGKRLGYGEMAVVHEVVFDHTQSSPALKACSYPPLVAKLSRPRHSEDLEQEFYYYEELEHAQGDIVARCYGFFEGFVPKDFSAVRLPLPERPAPREGETEEDVAGLYLNWERELCIVRGRVAILLLERLEGSITREIAVAHENLEAELQELFTCFASCGVYLPARTLRAENIMYTSSSSPPTEAARLPAAGDTGYSSRWRVIGLSLARKANLIEQSWAYHHEYAIEKILQKLGIKSSSREAKRKAREEIRMKNKMRALGVA